MSFKYKIAFIGFVGEGYGDLLNRLSTKLNEENIAFEALFFGQHQKALGLDEEYVFDYFDLKYLPHPDELIGSDELLVGILQADFYIVWNGYHNVYAKIRNYLDHIKIPYLLSEYSSIDKLYHFDTGLHGENSFVSNSTEMIKAFSLECLDKYVTARYESKNSLTLKSINDLQIVKKESKLVLYLGIWDEAAGLNSYTTDDTKKSLFPHYQSTFDSVKAMIKTLDTKITLVIKLHPNDNASDIESIQEFLKQYPNVVMVDKDVSAEELIKISDLTVTLTSTLSIYAAYHKIPLLLLANSYLNESGYAYQLEIKESLSEVINQALVKDDWEYRVKKRELFFQDFICNYYTYTIEPELIILGAKSIEALIERIVDKVSKIQGFKVHNGKLGISVFIQKGEQFKTYKIIKEREELYSIAEGRLKEINRLGTEREELYSIAEGRLKEINRLGTEREELYSIAEGRLKEINRLGTEREELYSIAEGRLKEINRLGKEREELYIMAEDRLNQLEKLNSSILIKILKKLGMVKEL